MSSVGPMAGTVVGVSDWRTKSALARFAALFGAGLLVIASLDRVEATTRSSETAMENAPIESAAQHRAEGMPGDQFRDCPVCPEMVVVPAGSYQMGSGWLEELGSDDERPMHEVTIAASFALGRHEVTVAEFERFVVDTGYSAVNSCYIAKSEMYEEPVGEDWRNPGFDQSGRHPVACVNWNDAQAYTAWLSRETGQEYRLPSESEWEYAAHPTTATANARPWQVGEWELCRHINFADGSHFEHVLDVEETGICRDHHVHTAPVGSFKANGWGLHDMLGNVAEWTEDCWNDSYANAPSDGSAWKEGNCDMRVYRGGSWISFPSEMRVENRYLHPAGDYGSFDIGFRVARTLAP